MSKPKILVVEDDDDLRHGLMLRLRASGYYVVQAGDGYGAISTANRENPDLILLDIGLPVGDGFTVLKRLSGLPALAIVPVIVLTGRDPYLTEPAVRKFRVAAFLRKPADNAELLDAVSRALNGEIIPPAPIDEQPWGAGTGRAYASEPGFDPR
jgi:DNA-binding response OmpR family regulator